MIKPILVSSVLVAVLACALAALAADADVTFHKDIEPILQRNCKTGCPAVNQGSTPRLSYCTGCRGT